MWRLSCDPGKVNNLQEKEMTKETKNREDKTIKKPRAIQTTKEEGKMGNFQFMTYWEKSEAYQMTSDIVTKHNDTCIQEEPQGLQADQENWTIELLPFRVSFCFWKYRDFAQKSGEQEAKLIHHATL